MFYVLHVVTATTTQIFAWTTPAHPRIRTHAHTHTQTATHTLQKPVHLFLVLSHPTVHTVSHSSSRALPFPAPSTTIIVSTPFPSLLRLCSLREMLPWKLATTDGLETSRLAYTIGKCTHTQRCMHKHTLRHSLLCKALRVVANFSGCKDINRRALNIGSVLRSCTFRSKHVSH